MFGEDVYNNGDGLVQLGRVDADTSMLRQLPHLDSPSPPQNVINNRETTTGKRKAECTSTSTLGHIGTTVNFNNINNDHPTDAQLEKVTMDLVTQRGACKTC